MPTPNKLLETAQANIQKVLQEANTTPDQAIAISGVLVQIAIAQHLSDIAFELAKARMNNVSPG
jgi:hypothetical protein